MSDQETNILFQNMRSMITLVDKLRDFHLNDYISLPRIAVVGEQSSGKSSLLESVCGLNFLPRGGGIVTRRPLELRMIKAPVTQPYFIFPKDKGETKFTDTKEVTKIIEELTDQITHGSKNVSNNPITCTVYSSSVPDLTLIDLPGMTRNPVEGQPQDIENIIKNMLKYYCKNPDTLILCVIPANIDLANSDAIKFARHLDPQGERTIGVLTKLDLMDEGTNAKEILLNNEIKLKYGYVGVKGRSQKEVNQQITVKQAISNELEFFSKHPVYNSLPSEVLGTRSLIDKISNLLFKMIEKSLPRIKKEIIDRKLNAKKSLNQLGESFPDTEEKKLEQVFKLVRQFKEKFAQEINGKYYYQKFDSKTIRQNETMIYKLNGYFSELYQEFSKKDYKACKDYTDEYIRHAINTYQNVSIPGFHSFDSFLYLIHPLLDKLKEPVFYLLEECKVVLEEEGVSIIDKIFKKMNILNIEIKEQFLKELHIRKIQVKKMLENLIKCEENYLFTNDTTFVTKSVIDDDQDKQRDLLALELRIKIDTYFFVIVRNLRDIIPKIIGQFFVKQFNKTIEMKILNALNKKDYCLSSLQENKLTAQQRQKLKLELRSLSKAESLLINDFNMGYHLDYIQDNKSTKPSIEIDFDNDNDDMDDYLQQLDKQNEEFLNFNQSQLNNNRNKTPQRNQYRQPQSQKISQQPQQIRNPSIYKPNQQSTSINRQQEQKNTQQQLKPPLAPTNYQNQQKPIIQQPQKQFEQPKQNQTQIQQQQQPQQQQQNPNNFHDFNFVDYKQKQTTQQNTIIQQNQEKEKKQQKSKWGTLFGS